MPHGGKLFIRTRQGSDWKSDRRGIVITVADTGSGIDPQIYPRIFEPFFTTKGYEGTGLGLWVTAEIVARHHGRLRVRSRRGPRHHGTIFSLFLPFADAGETAAAPR